MPCPQCRAEFELLEEKLRQLQAVFDEVLPLQEVKFSPIERQIYSLLKVREGKAVSKESMMIVLYFSEARDEPHPKILDVLICKIRKKLAGSDYWIKTHWGFGWSLESGQDPFGGQRRHGRLIRWTDEEDDLLRKSSSITEAALEIGRTPVAVVSRAQKIGHRWTTRRTHKMEARF